MLLQRLMLSASSFDSCTLFLANFNPLPAWLSFMLAWLPLSPSPPLRYAGLGTPDPALRAAVRKEFAGCAIAATMMNANGQLDGADRCLALFGTAHGPGGKPYLDTPAIAAATAAATGTAASAADESAAGTASGFHALVSRSLQRNVAASAQAVMEEEVVAMVREVLGSLNGAGGAVDGIVLVGGCALNVRVNSELAAAFPHLPVHVPAAPSDCGLAVGSGWLLAPPPLHGPPLRLHLLGPTPFDLAYDHDHRGGPSAALAEPELSAEGAARLSALGGVRLGASLAAAAAALAVLLADDQVIGVVRGRAEHGPRAFGHRSLLSAPSAGMKERMNALKHREWYRPVAPVLLAEEGDRVFERDSPLRPLHSPFMSFAPRLLPAAAAALPAVTHADATARPQTVTAGGDPWLHALLTAVKEQTGWGVLINTSFNTRGKPILNSVAEALALLRDCEDLDYVLVEDFLFPKAIVL